MFVLSRAELIQENSSIKQEIEASKSQQTEYWNQSLNFQVTHNSNEIQRIYA